MTLGRFQLLICGPGLHVLRSGNDRRRHIHKLDSPRCVCSVCWGNWEGPHEHTAHYHPRHHHSMPLYGVCQDRSTTATTLRALWAFLTVRITCAGCEGHAARGTPRRILVWTTACEWWVGRAVAPISGVFFDFFSFIIPCIALHKLRIRRGSRYTTQGHAWISRYPLVVR